MATLRINGGTSLSGTVTSSGAKNAALPIIASTLLFNHPVRLQNIPRIADIDILLRLISGIGKRSEWQGRDLIIDGSLTKSEPDRTLIKRLRASLLLMGPLLAVRGSASLAYPGGCYIGHRPINAHLDALRALGATVTEDGDDILLQAPQLKGAEITLPEVSVTGTENAVLAAVLAKGQTVIRLAAIEPHVQDLIHFLMASGAKIEGSGTHVITIQGVSALKPPGRYRIIPDGIEAGTFAIAAAATNSELTIEEVDIDYLEILFKKFDEVQAAYELDRPAKALRMKKGGQLRSTVEFKTGPYPYFPTDLQAPWALLMTQAAGASLIHDPMFEGRQAYIHELQRMGAGASILDPHRATITGPTPLIGTDVTALDLRAGATLVIAGLVAEGVTTIHKAEIIDRGYEAIDEKFRALGATIERAE